MRTEDEAVNRPLFPGLRKGNWQVIVLRPRVYFLGLITFAMVALVGCRSDSAAKRQARAAFLAGQQQTERRIQSQNSVSVLGAVRNQMVPWTEDLTLAKALIIADYTGNGTPKEIVLVRNGVAQRINPQELLGGQDMPLLQGDIIQIR